MGWVELGPILGERFGEHAGSHVRTALEYVVTESPPGNYMIRGNEVVRQGLGVTHAQISPAMVAEWTASGSSDEISGLIGGGRVQSAINAITSEDRPEIDVVARGPKEARWLADAVRDRGVRCSRRDIFAHFGHQEHLVAHRITIGRGLLDIGMLIDERGMNPRLTLNGASNLWGSALSNIMILNEVLGFIMPILPPVPMFSGEVTPGFSSVHQVLKTCVDGLNSGLGCFIYDMAMAGEIVRDIVHRSMTPPCVDRLLLLKSILTLAGRCPRYNEGGCNFVI